MSQEAVVLAMRELGGIASAVQIAVATGTCRKTVYASLRRLRRGGLVRPVTLPGRYGWTQWHAWALEEGAVPRQRGGA